MTKTFNVKLTNVSLENFKGVDIANVELTHPIVILTGKNDCGKTTFLDAIMSIVDPSLAFFERATLFEFSNP